MDDTEHGGSAMKRASVGMTVLVGICLALLALACEEQEEEAQTPTPTPRATLTPVVTPTLEATREAIPTPSGEIPTPTPTSSREIGVESIWHPLGEEARLTRLHECSRDKRTECVTAIMQDSEASPQATEFFRATGWFLGDFQEMGRVDLGSVVDPWRANENVQYAFLNGTPLVVHPEEEVQPVAIELDPNYDVLVAAFPDLFLWPGLGLFEALSTTEEGGQRFVIEFRLVDGCHACETGYRARVTFDFGVDGTYLGVGPLPLGLCWGEGPDVTPVSPAIPACPLP